jgi:hypothetical protein
MVRNAFPLVCIVLFHGLAAADDKIASTLAVQAALKQGRELLLRSDYQSAVHVLESQITRIEGNSSYLATLRDAYRGLIKSLRMAGKDEEAVIYVRRLQILDPGSALDFTSPKSETAAIPATVPAPAAAPEPRPPQFRLSPRELPASSPADPPSIDPFSVKNHRQYQEASALLDQADQLFKATRYNEAGPLYVRVNQTMPEAMGDSRERLAYCQLHDIVERLNQKDRPILAAEWPGIEKQIHDAMNTTTKLQSFGNTLLTTIASRRETPTTLPQVEKPKAVVEATSVEVKHTRSGKYAVVETANFRVFHNIEPAQAEQIAKAAETARAAAQKKWFGKVLEDWTLKCDVYLHPTADLYSRETGQSGSIPGHANLATQGERVVMRQLHLRLDFPGMMTQTLPHETTHVVLAGQFGPKPIPRWADEGMAVLSEPRDEISRHVRNLSAHRQAGQLFKLNELLALSDWPEAQRVGAFYAESVSVVDYLCGLRDQQTFAKFLKEGLSSGMDAALKKYYGIDGARDLETRWAATTFKGDGYAQRGE